MDPIPHLIRLARAYGAATGVELSTVSWRLFQDTKKLEALIDGRDIQVRRYSAALQWLADNWPEGTDRPEGLDRSVGYVVHGATLAPADGCGAENPERNVSRTDEPGLSPEGAAA
ncbi:hypothetical protein D3C71_231070 [compost metagenome]